MSEDQDDNGASGAAPEAAGTTAQVDGGAPPEHTSDAPSTTDAPQEPSATTADGEAAPPEAAPRIAGLTRDPSDEDIEVIAALCNDANAAYSASLGDFTYGPWAGVPDAIRSSIRDGVMKHLANPGMTPEESHEAWLAFKGEQGYVYGPQRDDAAKLHPCMVPYADLPQAQRSKDFIFRGVVHSAARVLGLL